MFNISGAQTPYSFGQLSDKIQNITGRHISKGEKAKLTSLSFEDTDWFREPEERPKSAFAVIVAVVCFYLKHSYSMTIACYR